MSKYKKFAAATTVSGMITVAVFINHLPKEYDRNINAIQKVEDVIRGKCFEEKFLSSNVDDAQMNGLAKPQIILKFRNSRTKIELEMYRSWRSTIGYTYASTERIWMNRKFHDRFDSCEVASNLAHEISHKIGFDHDLRATKRRPFSVPYVVGEVVRECCE